jgi:type VI secretion system protein ImpH
LATESRAAHPRVTDPEIAAMLEEQPYSFDFFQAVRLLERINPDRQPVGKFVPPRSEAAHFGVPGSLGFPASEIQAITWTEDEPPEMTVNFMGLTGPMGVLPLYYTELIASRLREGDRVLKDFLDIFNHRLISLFYRAWAKHRFSVAYEEEDTDRFSLQLLGLIGLGTAGLQGRQAVLDDLFIYYAGLLMGHSHSAAALKQILADYFDVTVEIEEFAGSWYKLDSRMQSCLDEAGGDSGRLGFGVVAGDEVWQDESTVRIKVGPLSLEKYLDFLPGGGAYKALVALTRFFSGDELDFELQLILKRDEVPACALGAEGQAGPRLGWVTWIKSLPFGQEARTILRL